MKKIVIAVVVALVVAACGGQTCGGFCCVTLSGGGQQCRSVHDDSECLASEHYTQVSCSPLDNAGGAD